CVNVAQVGESACESAVVTNSAPSRCDKRIFLKFATNSSAESPCRWATKLEAISAISACLLATCQYSAPGTTPSVVAMRRIVMSAKPYEFKSSTAVVMISSRVHCTLGESTQCIRAANSPHLHRNLWGSLKGLGKFELLGYNAHDVCCDVLVGSWRLRHELLVMPERNLPTSTH